MKITCDEFAHEARIPEAFAFGKPDAESHFALSSNRNPTLRWSDVPDGCRSLVLICVDPDAPTVGDDVNQEGRTVPHDLPRADFYHWVMVDIPVSVSSIEAGACSDGVTAGGKTDPPGPAGARQGVNDYTGWFANDEDMGGTYWGYDGPAPPWNDERIHRYRFRLFAVDLETCPVDGAFTPADVLQAIDGHVLAEAVHTGRYSMNQALL